MKIIEGKDLNSVEVPLKWWEKLLRRKPRMIFVEAPKGTGMFKEVFLMGYAMNITDGKVEIGGEDKK